MSAPPKTRAAQAEAAELARIVRADRGIGPVLLALALTAWAIAVILP